MSRGNQYTKKDAIEALRRVDKSLDKNITLSDYNRERKDSEPESSIFYVRFDGFNNAKKEINVEVNNQGYSHAGPAVVDWYEYIKDLSVCQLCDENEDICLTFHHLPEYEKKFELSDAKGGSWGISKVFNESLKCAILCMNCHRKVHGNLIDREIKPWYKHSDQWYVDYSEVFK
jgi:hypothetical protein